MWEDTLSRVVDIDTLRRVCAAASGMSHRFTVEAGRTRVRLEYSNPDEWGGPRPYVAFLPSWREGGRTLVLLRVASDRGAEDEHGRESCFQTLDSEILSARAVRPDGTTDSRPPLLSHFAADTLRRAADLCRAIEAGEADRAAARDVLRSCNILTES